MSDAFLPNFQEPEPTTQAQATATAAPIQSAEAAPLAQPAPLTNGLGEMVSPELLLELQSYIEQAVVATVSQAITTVIPDVVETTLSKVQQQSAQPLPQSQQLAPVPDDCADFNPGRYQGRRPAEVRSDWLAWAACGGIVVTLAGVIAFIATANPSASTERVVNEQGTQIQQKDLLIKDLATQASKSNCKVLCF